MPGSCDSPNCPDPVRCRAIKFARERNLSKVPELCSRHYWQAARGTYTGLGDEKEWEIPRDGIIDLVAVRNATYGIRKVTLTRDELEIVVQAMIQRGKGPTDIARNTGISIEYATRLARLAGWSNDG